MMKEWNISSNHENEEKSIKQVRTLKVDKRYFGFIDKKFDLTETTSKRTQNETNQKEKMFVMKSSIYPQNFTLIGVSLTIEIILGVSCPHLDENPKMQLDNKARTYLQELIQ
jgi:hypothetical protein